VKQKILRVLNLTVWHSLQRS